MVRPACISTDGGTARRSYQGTRARQEGARHRVANVFDDLKRLRAGITLGMPLRQAIEHGRD